MRKKKMNQIIQDEDEKLVLSKLQISLMDCPCIWQTYHQKFACDVCTVYHRGKKRNSCPKMENQGSRTTKNDEVSGLMNIFKLQNPLFEQVNTKKKMYFF